MEREEATGNVKVLCRFRPLNEKEKGMSNNICASFSPDNRTVSIQNSESSNGPLRFNFDYVFTPDASQVDVYTISAKPIVQAVMQGFNGTVFAYGQTSSGKTFTMTGPDIENLEMMGIIPRMVNTVFSNIMNSDQKIEYSVKVAYAEIYLEKIRDLMEPSKCNLKIHQDRNRGVYIADLTETYVSSDMEVYNLMKYGNQNREVAYTHMNAGSSRSHSLFIITISQTNSLDFSAKTGKLYLVDLAGSEKVGKTGAEGKRLEEAKNINKSLTTLGLVIYSLTDGRSTHIPYRDSKLTRVLQDSLGGNSKTALIVTCSPSPYNEAQTISTLRFGIRAKSIKNKPKVNREYTVAELKLMLAKAKQEIANRDIHIRNLEKTLKELGADFSSFFSQEQQKMIRSMTIQQESYDQVIVELEQARNRLGEEVEQHLKLKQQHQIILEEHTKFSQKYLKYKELCEEQKAALQQKQNKLSLTEEIVQKLADTKQSLEKQMDFVYVNKLNLEQELNKKQVEIENIQIELQIHKVEGRSQAAQQTIEQLQREIEELKDQLQLANSQKQIIRSGFDKRMKASLPQITDLRAELTQEIQNMEKIKFQAEKNSLIVDLQNKIQKIVKLEIKNYEWKERYQSLESTMNEGERALKKKCDTLERNLQQLTLMYHQLISQKSILKVDKQVSQRKISRLTEKIKNLERQNAQQKKDLMNEKEKSRKIAKHMDDIGNGRMFSFVSPANFARNIRKPIIGGGGSTASRYQIHSTRNIHAS